MKKAVQSLPKELHLKADNDSNLGRLCLAKILADWINPKRDELLPSTLRVLVDTELYWVVDDTLQSISDQKVIRLAEEILDDFAAQTVKKMLAIAKRGMSKSKINRYTNASVSDLKIAGIVSMFISLYDEATDYLVLKLDKASEEPKKLPPPKKKE